MRTGRTNKGPGKGEKSKATKAKDTATSPYYQTLKKGGIKAHLAKEEMRSYFKNTYGNNKRGESEAEHITRNKKREQANRKKMGLK